MYRTIHNVNCVPCVAQEDEMAKKYQTSIRNIPFEGQGPAGAEGAGKCILTGKPSAGRVVMSEAY